MTAKELLALLQEAETVFWDGLHKSFRDEDDEAEMLRLIEITDLIKEEGFELSCSVDGTLWHLLSKEVQ